MDGGRGGGNESLWHTNFKPDVFRGEGDYWFNVYGMMKAHCIDSGGEWAQHYPLTNVMWLHYLACQLLFTKGLPQLDQTAYPTKEDEFAELTACSWLVRIEKKLGSSLAQVGGEEVVNASGRVLTIASGGTSGACAKEFTSAKEVLKWCEKQGLL
ncbi:hypothetical protein FRC12_001397 [Ceratobasidium sp. 428]|nr:hypothetical protein FRC12_001397 [Ceratobasidium sp. 428]